MTNHTKVVLNWVSKFVSLLNLRLHTMSTKNRWRTSSNHQKFFIIKKRWLRNLTTLKYNWKMVLETLPIQRQESMFRTKLIILQGSEIWSASIKNGCSRTLHGEEPTFLWSIKWEAATTVLKQLACVKFL